MNEKHPDADEIDSATFQELTLRRISRDGPGAHDLSGHGNWQDGPSGLTLSDLSAGDVIVRRHACGAIDWRGGPLTVTRFRWCAERQEHALGLVDSAGVEGYDHAADWGLEEHGVGYTTVDTTEGSPTYMREIVHPMCGRWNGSNTVERPGGFPMSGDRPGGESMPASDNVSLRRRVEALPVNTLIRLGWLTPSERVQGSLYLRTKDGLRYAGPARDNREWITLGQETENPRGDTDFVIVATPAAPVSPVEGERRAAVITDDLLRAAKVHHGDSCSYCTSAADIDCPTEAVLDALSDAPAPLPVDSEERPDTARLLTREQVVEAIQDAWNDFVSDTGCFPDAFTHEGRGMFRLNAGMGNWATWITDHLNRSLADAHPAASAAPGGQDGRALERVRQAYSEALGRAMSGDLQFETRVLYQLLTEFDALPTAPEVPRTGAERYFADRMTDPEYRDAYQAAEVPRPDQEGGA